MTSQKNKAQKGFKTNSNSLRSSISEAPICKLTQLSKKLKNNFILTIFEQTRDQDVYKCKVCTKSPTIEYKNIKRHLLDSEAHERCTKIEDMEHYQKLLLILRETNKNNKVKNKEELGEIGNFESLQHKRGLLKFLGA